MSFHCDTGPKILEGVINEQFVRISLFGCSEIHHCRQQNTITMSAPISKFGPYVKRKRAREERTDHGPKHNPGTSCAGAMAAAHSARRAIALCCLFLLTRPPPAKSFQIGPGLHTRSVSRSIDKSVLKATREPPPTTQSDKPDVTIMDDGDSNNDNDDDIGEEDKMKIPLMSIDGDGNGLETPSTDGSDLPGSADAFDYAWDRSSQAFLDWTSGTSIGSFLLQRQREEEDAAIVREVDSQTGQAEYSTDLGGEQLVRDQSRRMEGRKRRKERRKERMVEAQLEELRQQQRDQQSSSLGGIQIIDDTATSGVGKQIIEDKKSNAAAGPRRKSRRKDDGDREERKSRARLWRRKKRDQAKARQKAFDVDRVSLCFFCIFTLYRPKIFAHIPFATTSLLCRNWPAK